VVGSHSLKATPADVNPHAFWYPRSELLTGDAAAGQKNVTVAAGGTFTVGDNVQIYDDTPLDESNTVASIAGNVLTMQTNLANAYAVANNAYVQINAEWDLTKIGSEVTPSYLSFYYYQTNANMLSGIYLNTLYGDGSAPDGYSMNVVASGNLFSQVDEWSHISLPVGSYHAIHLDETGKEWITNNNADWTNTNSIQFNIAAANNGEDCYIDDLHFTGQIVREAWDISEVAANNYYPRFIRNDAATNDTLIASDATGTAGQLCYAELVRRKQTPLVGMFWTPLAPTALPGQIVHIHASATPDTVSYPWGYKIDSYMRVKEV